MSIFIQKLKENLNYTTTENGAKTHKSSLSACLDLFSLGGAFRNRSEKDIIQLFYKAFCENQLLALRILFYLRDIREGAGERRFFRVILKYLADNYPELLVNNIKYIPYFGRWDDLYELFDTSLEQDAINLIRVQILEDLKSENPSLCAKWLKSTNTSSRNSRYLAEKTRKGLNLTEKVYRHTLSHLRNKIDIVEKKLSNKDYNIDYSKLPSQALLKYQKTFFRNDFMSYTAYLSALKENKTKINTSTLFPHQIVHKILYNNCTKEDLMALDLMWTNLPTIETNDNILVVADVSGSMYGTPLEVAISLAIYFAERNKGAFKDYFMTFSENPVLQKIEGRDIKEKINSIATSEWGYNTDIENVFLKILDTAVKNNLPQEELPSKIIIISDMEFDEATQIGIDSPIFETLKKKFAEKGYKLPKLVFWNVDARQNQAPITKDEENCTLISGFSLNLFKCILSGEDFSPEKFMLSIVNSERYECINI